MTPAAVASAVDSKYTTVFHLT